ncbi:MAG: hypothetical protein HKN21_02110, partial [Candidatus Eisenbacteria bacterium]|nr:hypothetical protein [Candidatus Eisenbacteria bacterium]
MHEIHHQQELMTHLDAKTSLSSIAVQGLDLTNLSEAIKRVEVDGALFMGCVISDELLCHLHRSGALVFPELPDLPFKPYRPTLYTPEELFAEFDPKEPCTYCRTPDARIYRHWHNSGRDQPDNILTTLSRRLHDHAISDGIDDFLKSVAKDRLVVAIMGGHSMERSEEAYLEIARLARNMTREGLLLASGGGPGAMEATHLGAWFADREEADLDDAVAHLAQAGSYRDYDWLARAFEVKAKYPAPGENHVSLGIPTWLYGHEPPNPFATHIAKYFANSVREDGLVTIAKGGIVFAPGSAGTIQE